MSLYLVHIPSPTVYGLEGYVNMGHPSLNLTQASGESPQIVFKWDRDESAYSVVAIAAPFSPEEIPGLVLLPNPIATAGLAVQLDSVLAIWKKSDTVTQVVTSTGAYLIASPLADVKDLLESVPSASPGVVEGIISSTEWSVDNGDATITNATDVAYLSTGKTTFLTGQLTLTQPPGPGGTTDLTLTLPTIPNDVTTDGDTAISHVSGDIANGFRVVTVNPGNPKSVRLEVELGPGDETTFQFVAVLGEFGV